MPDEAAARPAAATPRDGADGPSRGEIRIVFLGLVIVLGLAALDQSIVATALPRIVGELGGMAHLSWVVTAYVLASTATMPLYGKLSDQYGRKPLLYAAIVIFLIGSVLSGAAQNLFELILFRAVQGLGAGGLLPLAQIIIGDIVPPRERGRRQGAIAAVFAVCSVVGPVLGGVITDLLSWHWIFYVNLPIGALALVVFDRALRRPHHPAQQRRVDYLGAALLTAGTTTFLLVLALGGTEWPWASPEVAVATVTGLVLTALFVLHILREPEPVLPPELFRSRLFVIASGALALTTMGMMGSGTFFPLFFQVVMDINPSMSGFLTGPLMLGVVLSSFVNGRLLLRYGRYKPALTVGLATAALAFAALSFCVATSQTLSLIEPAMFALGSGLGLVMPNATIAVQNALPFANRGVGTATLAFFRSLGGLIGVTGAGAILAQRLHITGALGKGGMPTGAADPALIDVYRQAIAAVFVSGTFIVAIALIAVVFLPELPLTGDTRPAGKPAS